MTTTNKINIGIVIGILLATIVLLFAFIQGKAPSAVGSIQDGQGYAAYRFNSANASSSAQQVKVGPGMFGSVVITATSTGGSLEVYDGVISGTRLNGAALTNNINATTTATTTLAVFNGAAGVGTYTFDIATNQSLFVQPTVGFNGSYTITYK